MRIDGGVITQIGEQLDANEHRVVDAAGKTLVPAFVDPHVHLRTPGREDEETIESGTAAAAAGGYCAILAMPNTEPVVDDPEIIRGLRTRAETEAQIPVGFFAAITKGQARLRPLGLGAVAADHLAKDDLGDFRIGHAGVGVLLDVRLDAVQLEEGALPGDRSGATGDQQRPVYVEEDRCDANLAVGEPGGARARAE